MYNQSNYPFFYPNNDYPNIPNFHYNNSQYIQKKRKMDSNGFSYKKTKYNKDLGFNENNYYDNIDTYLNEEKFRKKFDKSKIQIGEVYHLNETDPQYKNKFLTVVDFDGYGGFIGCTVNSHPSDSAINKTQSNIRNYVPVKTTKDRTLYVACNTPFHLSNGRINKYAEGENIRYKYTLKEDKISEIQSKVDEIKAKKMSQFSTSNFYNFNYLQPNNINAFFSKYDDHKSTKYK